MDFCFEILFDCLGCWLCVLAYVFGEFWVLCCLVGGLVIW